MPKLVSTSNSLKTLITKLFTTMEKTIKNLYYRNTFARQNNVKVLFLSFCSLFMSYPRMLLEVFTRKNFGERYFSLSSAIILALILAVLPLGITQVSSFVGGSENIEQSYSYDENFGNNEQPQTFEQPSTDNVMFPAYIGWYCFILAFLFFCFKHYLDNRRSPSAFNFSRFTLSSGIIHPMIRNIKISGFQPDIRFIECFLEPLIFFVAGLLLAVLGQSVGYLLIVCAFFYSMSYVGSYVGGDNFIMDKIDEIICNEVLENAFVEGHDIEETKGFQFRGRKPTTDKLRKQILPLLMVEEEVMDAE